MYYYGGGYGGAPMASGYGVSGGAFYPYGGAVYPVGGGTGGIGIWAIILVLFLLFVILGVGCWGGKSWC
ncbi:TPA: sporulation protein YjcZ [bacterium]|nr:sporulation protein YjcZ [bacterium]